MDIDDFDLHFTNLMSNKEIIISSKTKDELPEKIVELVHLEILRVRCPGVREMPSSLGLLTALKTLDLRENAGLKELPVALGTLASIKRIDVSGCPSLHTPPKHVVERGTDAMLQFLRDLAKGEAPSHLIKVVLLGDQRAGKSSLADSLVLGRPVMRADNDRTVGIEVRRWRLGGQSPLVANIYDAAGQRVYRATHGFFMSPGALFLHVVRSNLPEEETVMALLEWVEAVQQEAPGAVMGVVWTHVDRPVDVSLTSFTHASPEELHRRHMVQVPRKSTSVLSRVKAGIEQQVQVLDEALRQLEAVIERNCEELPDLSRKWAQEREQRDAALVVLDRQAMIGCQTKDKMDMIQAGNSPSGREEQVSPIEEMSNALTNLRTHHKKMHSLEEKIVASLPRQDGESILIPLQRLREQREQRPRILVSYEVSSKTGYGLKELRHGLAALMEEQRLFPDVGRKVPLNYSMLERLAQEGRAEASEGTGHDVIGTGADRADWEQAVTKHVTERASVQLRAVCGKACVSLDAWRRRRPLSAWTRLN